MNHESACLNSNMPCCTLSGRLYKHAGMIALCAIVVSAGFLFWNNIEVIQTIAEIKENPLNQPHAACIIPPNYWDVKTVTKEVRVPVPVFVYQSRSVDSPKKTSLIKKKRIAKENTISNTTNTTKIQS